MKTTNQRQKHFNLNLNELLLMLLFLCTLLCSANSQSQLPNKPTELTERKITLIELCIKESQKSTNPQSLVEIQEIITFINSYQKDIKIQGNSYRKSYQISALKTNKQINFSSFLPYIQESSSKFLPRKRDKIDGHESRYSIVDLRGVDLYTNKNYNISTNTKNQISFINKFLNQTKIFQNNLKPKK